MGHWPAGAANSAFAPPRPLVVRTLMIAAKAASQGSFPNAALKVSKPRPSSAPLGRPSSAASVAHQRCGQDASLSRRQRPRSAGCNGRWTVPSSVPRSFDELKTHYADGCASSRELAMKWGPREEYFQQIGLRLSEWAENEKALESARARDGEIRRKSAEEKRRAQHHISSGQPWRRTRHSSTRQCGTTPRHVPAGHLPCDQGLFSYTPLLEATESQARWKDAMGSAEEGQQAVLRRESLRKRPAGAGVSATGDRPRSASFGSFGGAAASGGGGHQVSLGRRPSSRHRRRNGMVDAKASAAAAPPTPMPVVAGRPRPPLTQNAQTAAPR